jgi:cytochrome b561
MQCDMLMNSEDRYGLVARGLHWTVAVLVIGLLWLGWYMVDVGYYGRWYNASLQWHKGLGMLALLAGGLQAGWAAGTRAPVPLTTVAAWERLGARAVRLILLAMVVAIPLTGYIISTSAGDGISIFGWLEVPAVLPESEILRDLAVDLHYYLAYVTAALVLLHVLAALKHQLIDGDGTLRRML